MADYDVIIAGGGLAGTLIALRLAARGGLSTAIIESGAQLGGEHTWSFHGTDVPAATLGWLGPYIAYSWAGQSVCFPAHSRALSTPYHSITSDSLHAAAAPRLAGGLRLGESVLMLGPGEVVTSGGRKLTAPCVIDARGPMPSPALDLAFQKFLGFEVRTAQPHGLRHPIIMDATVPQEDGYRFVYCLPFSADTMLIEDTYYADGATLDTVALGTRIRDYAATRGWHIAETLRTEHGVLPVVLGGDIDAFWRTAQGQPARVGLRAGLFHPTTGYSLPDAAQLADSIAALPELTTAAVAAHVEAVSRRAWHERGMFRLLNRMLFRAAQPHHRYRVLERFYRLPQPLVERFYASQLHSADKLRILAGKPPVPLSRAIGQLVAPRPHRVGIA